MATDRSLIQVNRRLLKELIRACELIELALSRPELPGRVRWRLILGRDRINAALRAARKDNQ